MTQRCTMQLGEFYCQSFLCAAERRRKVVKEEKVLRKRSITAKQRQEAFETLVQLKIQKMIRVATISLLLFPEVI